MMPGEQHAEPCKRPSSCYPRILYISPFVVCSMLQRRRRLCVRLPVVPSYRRDKEESCVVHYGDVANVLDLLHHTAR